MRANKQAGRYPRALIIRRRPSFCVPYQATHGTSVYITIASRKAQRANGCLFSRCTRSLFGQRAEEFADALEYGDGRITQGFHDITGGAGPESHEEDQEGYRRPDQPLFQQGVCLSCWEVSEFKVGHGNGSGLEPPTFRPKPDALPIELPR